MSSFMKYQKFWYRYQVSPQRLIDQIKLLSHQLFHIEDLLSLILEYSWYHPPCYAKIPKNVDIYSAIDANCDESEEVDTLSTSDIGRIGNSCFYNISEYGDPFIVSWIHPSGKLLGVIYPDIKFYKERQWKDNPIEFVPRLRSKEVMEKWGSWNDLSYDSYGFDTVDIPETFHEVHILAPHNVFPTRPNAKILQIYEERFARQSLLLCKRKDILENENVNVNERYFEYGINEGSMCESNILTADEYCKLNSEWWTSGKISPRTDLL